MGQHKRKKFHFVTVGDLKYLLKEGELRVAKDTELVFAGTPNTQRIVRRKM
jgi:hypothetical protein